MLPFFESPNPMVKKPEKVFPSPPQTVDWNQFVKMVHACGWHLVSQSKPTHYEVVNEHGQTVSTCAKHHKKGGKDQVLRCYVKDLTNAAINAGKL